MVHNNPIPIDVVWCCSLDLTRPNRSTDIADRLKSKVALVVGAGSIGPGWGNGKATAVAFAREGARVFCADINLAAAEETVGIIKGEGGEALAHRADASKAADVAAMIEACVSAYDRIDVLNNNVGIAEVGGLVEVSEADWDRVWLPRVPRKPRYVRRNLLELKDKNEQYIRYLYRGGGRDPISELNYWID